MNQNSKEVKLNLSVDSSRAMPVLKAIEAELERIQAAAASINVQSPEGAGQLRQLGAMHSGLSTAARVLRQSVQSGSPAIDLGSIQSLIEDSALQAYKNPADAVSMLGQAAGITGETVVRASQKPRGRAPRLPMPVSVTDAIANATGQIPVVKGDVNREIPVKPQEPAQADMLSNMKPTMSPPASVPSIPPMSALPGAAPMLSPPSPGMDMLSAYMVGGVRGPIPMGGRQYGVPTIEEEMGMLSAYMAGPSIAGTPPPPSSTPITRYSASGQRTTSTAAPVVFSKSDPVGSTYGPPTSPPPANMKALPPPPKYWVDPSGVVYIGEPHGPLFIPGPGTAPPPPGPAPSAVSGPSMPVRAGIFQKIWANLRIGDLPYLKGIVLSDGGQFIGYGFGGMTAAQYAAEYLDYGTQNILRGRIDIMQQAGVRGQLIGGAIGGTLGLGVGYLLGSPAFGFAFGAGIGGSLGQAVSQRFASGDELTAQSAVQLLPAAYSLSRLRGIRSARGLTVGLGFYGGRWTTPGKPVYLPAQIMSAKEQTSYIMANIVDPIKQYRLGDIIDIPGVDKNLVPYSQEEWEQYIPTLAEAGGIMSVYASALMQGGLNPEESTRRSFLAPQYPTEEIRDFLRRRALQYRTNIRGASSTGAPADAAINQTINMIDFANIVPALLSGREDQLVPLKRIYERLGMDSFAEDLPELRKIAEKVRATRMSRMLAVPDSETLVQTLTRRTAENWLRAGPEAASALSGLLKTFWRHRGNTADMLFEAGPEVAYSFSDLFYEKEDQRAPNMGAYLKWYSRGLAEERGEEEASYMIRGGAAALSASRRRRMELLEEIPGGRESLLYAKARKGYAQSLLQQYHEEDTTSFMIPMAMMEGERTRASMMPYGPGNVYGKSLQMLGLRSAYLATLQQRYSLMMSEGLLSEADQYNMIVQMEQLKTANFSDIATLSEGTDNRMPALSAGGGAWFGRFDTAALAAANIGYAGHPSRFFGAASGRQARRQRLFLQSAAGGVSMMPPVGQMQTLDSPVIAGSMEEMVRLLRSINEKMDAKPDNNLKTRGTGELPPSGGGMQTGNSTPFNQ